MTRGSITGQVKALTMIVAMENFIPDRRAVSAQKKSDLAPTQPQIYPAVGHPEPKLAPGSAGDAPPNPSPSQSTLANRSTPSKPPVPYVPLFTSVPDLGVDFPTKNTPLNPFVRPR
jgi:hypothetical protein